MALSTPPPPDPDRTALFLDLDGTLFTLQQRPEMVRGDRESAAILTGLEGVLQGRIAVLTGRSLEDADRILSGQVPAVSGSHGLERRDADGQVHRAPPHPAVDEARRAFAAFAAAHPGVILEDKGLGVCLHFRTAPELETEVLALGGDLAGRLPLQPQPGSMMFELRTPGGGKGAALEAYLSEPPFQGAVPVFVGDDLTDEHGFLAAEALGGYGVIVGGRRPTAARYALPDVAAVRRWLAETAAETSPA
jgi:trehalose 6-phosphate phosphatase